MKIYSSRVFCKYKGVRGSKGLAAHKTDSAEKSLTCTHHAEYSITRLTEE